MKRINVYLITKVYADMESFHIIIETPKGSTQNIRIIKRVGFSNSIKFYQHECYFPSILAFFRVLKAKMMTIRCAGYLWSQKFSRMPDWRPIIAAIQAGQTESGKEFVMIVIFLFPCVETIPGYRWDIRYTIGVQKWSGEFFRRIQPSWRKGI